MQQQYSKNKKMALLDRKRFGTAEGAPKIVVCVNMNNILYNFIISNYIYHLLK